MREIKVTREFDYPVDVLCETIPWNHDQLDLEAWLEVASETKDPCCFASLFFRRPDCVGHAEQDETCCPVLD